MTLNFSEQPGVFKRRGLTLVEIMLTTLILALLFAGILTVMTSSSRSWQIGRDKLSEQQNARRAMDGIAGPLRQSSPAWGVYIGGTNQDKIQFNTGAAADQRVIIKLDPADPAQLVRQIGPAGNWDVLARDVKSVKFCGGDCGGCNCNYSNPGCSSCLAVTNNCPVVKIEIVTRKENALTLNDPGFTLVSYVSLRNAQAVTAAIPEPPATGEF